MDAENFGYPVEVTIFRKARYDGEWMPSSLVDALKWLESKLGCVPEAYRSTATIEIDSESSWEDSHYPSIEIVYTRPPTESEVEARKAVERQRVEQQVEETRQRAEALERQLAALRR